MSSALQSTLFAILGTGLAALSATSLVLWRRVRALTRPDRSPTTIALPTPVAGPSGPVGIPLKPPPRPRTEFARRLDELDDRHRALEARLARVEASTAEVAMASRPGAGRRFDRGGKASPGGPTLIAVPNLAAPPSATSEAAAELDRRFGPVWAMADAGLSAEAIARETGHPIGQVELILNLRRRLPAVEAGPDA